MHTLSTLLLVLIVERFGSFDFEFDRSCTSTYSECLCTLTLLANNNCIWFQAITVEYLVLMKCFSTFGQANLINLFLIHKKFDSGGHYSLLSKILQIRLFVTIKVSYRFTEDCCLPYSTRLHIPSYLKINSVFEGLIN